MSRPALFHGVILFNVLVLLEGGRGCGNRKTPTSALSDGGSPASRPSSFSFSSSASASAQVPLPPPLPLFADDPNDPYNELHRLLFGDAATHFRWSGCSAPSSSTSTLVGDGGGAAGCEDDVAQPIGLDRAPVAWTDLPPYADRPIATVSSEALSRLPSRAAAIEQAARRVMEINPRTRRSAAVLLQRDLWAMFDALHRMEESDAAISHELAAVRDNLGRTIVALALPASESRALGPTLSDVLSSRSNNDLFGSAVREGAFVEVLSHESEPPSAAPRASTQHARARAFRSVFRRYVRLPSVVAADAADGDADAALERVRVLVRGSPASVRLPEGSLSMIVETPLVLSGEGDLVALSMVTLIEIRRVVSIPTPARLGQLGFDVLEGTRKNLRADIPHLERLGVAAPFPTTGSCGPSDGSYVPMRRSCILCHGFKGDELRSFAHGPAAFQLPATPLEAADAVVHDKSKRGDFAALRRFFSRAR